MEKETYVKTIDDTEYKLDVEYEKRLSYEDMKSFDPTKGFDQGGDLAAPAVSEWPDKVVIGIRSKGTEKILSLTGTEYRELRELLGKDMSSGRYVGALPLGRIR